MPSTWRCALLGAPMIGIIACGKARPTETEVIEDFGPATTMGTPTSAGSGAASTMGSSAATTGMGGAAAGSTATNTAVTDSAASSMGGLASTGAGGSGSTSGEGGSGGSGGSPMTGTPHVFVGSTNGMLRAYVMSTTDGSLEPAGSEDTGTYLDFMSVAPNRTTVFVSGNRSVAAYDYDPEMDSFSFVAEADTGGVGTHVNVDPSGGFVFVAHYNEGRVSFLSFDPDSGFGSSESVSPGQNAHQVRIDAAGQYVYVPCLGSNHVAQYDLDAVGGTLSASATPTAPAAGGPRHMAFHPSASVAYVLTEVESTIHVYDVDPTTGALSQRSDGSVFLSADEQGHWSSDIRITPAGDFLYAVDRDPPEIVAFAVDGDESLTRLSSTTLSGVVRSFAMDPGGKFLQVGGDDGNLHALSIEADGSLTSTGTQSGLGDIHSTQIAYLP